jgi:hypothetical protein
MKRILVFVMLVGSMAFGQSDAERGYVTGLTAAVASKADWVMTVCPDGLSAPVIACVFGSGMQDFDKILLDLYVPEFVSWISPWVRSSPKSIGRAMSTSIGEMHVMIFETGSFETLVLFWLRY